MKQQKEWEWAACCKGHKRALNTFIVKMRNMARSCVNVEDYFQAMKDSYDPEVAESAFRWRVGAYDGIIANFFYSLTDKEMDIHRLVREKMKGRPVDGVDVCEPVRYMEAARLVLERLGCHIPSEEELKRSNSNA